MIADATIRLAAAGDARLIAELSRDHIERGLGWRWTPARIAAAMNAHDMNLAVACRGDALLGFGLMRYKDDEAHLSLLAVADSARRQGVATALLGWLECCALTAGIGIVRLEARASNRSALAFYRRRGYRPVARAPGYYLGREDAIRLARDLWAEPTRA